MKYEVTIMGVSLIVDAEVDPGEPGDRECAPTPPAVSIDVILDEDAEAAWAPLGEPAQDLTPVLSHKAIEAIKAEIIRQEENHGREG